MLARMTTFEGGTPEGIRAMVAEMRQNMQQGPPPGVHSTGFTLLTDAEGGRVVMVGLFEDAEKLEASEAALQAMDLPEGVGSMTRKEILEVGAEIRM